MIFNSDKCEVLRITKKKKALTQKYMTVDQAKYLVTTISNALSWNKHVDYVVKKDSLNFLKQNLPGSLSQVKENCYESLMRPVILVLCLGPANINKLEKVQRRTSRFVKGDYDRTIYASRPENEFSPIEKAAEQDSDVVQNCPLTGSYPNNSTPHLS